MADKEITPKTAPAEKAPAADAALNEIDAAVMKLGKEVYDCLLYTSPSPRDRG